MLLQQGSLDWLASLLRASYMSYPTHDLSINHAVSKKAQIKVKALLCGKQRRTGSLSAEIESVIVAAVDHEHTSIYWGNLQDITASSLRYGGRVLLKMYQLECINSVPRLTHHYLCMFILLVSCHIPSWRVMTMQVGLIFIQLCMKRVYHVIFLHCCFTNEKKLNITVSHISEIIPAP